MNRIDLPALSRVNKPWIELGVASGAFSEQLLRLPNCKLLYSVDCWAGDRGHDDAQYNRAITRLRRVGSTSSRVLREFFSDAVKRFPDEYFGFIYIDGYAHTGQDSGQTLYEWWPKLAKGGLFAGHDYCAEWQPTVEAVNRFAEDMDKEVRVTNGDDRYPSWYFWKE